MLRSLLLPLLMLCAATQAIADDARSATASVNECPDLAGTYEVRIPAWADKLHPFGQRARIKTRQFATFQRIGDGYKLIWHASRQDFLAAARALAERRDPFYPYMYDNWLEKILRDPKLPLPPGVNSEQEWSNRISNVGPVFRGVDELLPLRRCKRGWFLLIGPGRRDGPADFAGGMKGTRDMTIWLGRDKDGALSLKVEEQETFEVLRPYRGDKGVAIPLRTSTHLAEKWPVAPAQDLSPIRAGELPERIRPVRPTP